VRRLRRIAAYGVCRDDAGRVLLVRASPRSHNHGAWFLPGGGVEHGEHPAAAAVREVEEETGLQVAIERLRDVVTDVERLPEPALRHQDRLIFDCRVIAGTVRDEADGSTDHVAWVTPEEFPDLPLMPFVRDVLCVPASAGRPTDRRDRAAAEPDVGPAAPPERFQRFAAYGLITAPDGRVLLTRIADGYPGAGRWHLPGGGTDFGEGAADGLLREVVEETGQQARLTQLLSVSHRHQRAAFGPEGVPIDWHGVRVVYRGLVDNPSVPRVVEARGGSTAEAAWLPPGRALQLPLTEIAREMIETQLG